VSPEELLVEVGALVGSNVAVAYHPGGPWNPALHAQGRLQRDPDEPETGFAIGKTNAHWRGLSVDHVALSLRPADVVEARWRDDVLPVGGIRVLVITTRDGAVLTLLPL
jgi:hypothetical protein